MCNYLSDCLLHYLILIMPWLFSPMNFIVLTHNYYEISIAHISKNCQNIPTNMYLFYSTMKSICSKDFGVIGYLIYEL